MNEKKVIIIAKVVTVTRILNITSFVLPFYFSVRLKSIIENIVFFFLNLHMKQHVFSSFVFTIWHSVRCHQFILKLVRKCVCMCMARKKCAVHPISGL